MRAVGQRPSVSDDEFGRRGWVVLAALAIALVVAPGIIYWRPPQLPFEVAFLVVPLVPAFLLGAVAVWAMVGEKPER
jgi:peptidoglycan/LPS O-acetylase OafA/YrhL